MTDLLVPPDEIERLTGYKRPSRQVDELRRRGFHRARRNHAGQVILERALSSIGPNATRSGAVLDALPRDMQDCWWPTYAVIVACATW